MILLAVCAFILGFFFPPLWLLVPVFLAFSVVKDTAKIGKEAHTSAVLLGEYMQQRREQKRVEEAQNPLTDCPFCKKPVNKDSTTCIHCKRTLRK